MLFSACFSVSIQANPSGLHSGISPELFAKEFWLNFGEEFLNALTDDDADAKRSCRGGNVFVGGGGGVFSFFFFCSF